MNGNLRRLLGEHIRKYRKANNMTLDELASHINKSKATVSKYESGQITLDVDTLSEIVDVLHISAAHLFQLVASNSEQANIPPPSSSVFPFITNRMSEQRVLYMYFWDGRIRQMILSLFYINLVASSEDADVYLHYHIDAFDKPHECKGFYAGKVSIVNPYMNFSLKNMNNNIENMYIVAKETFNDRNILVGLLTAVSFINFQPISYKIILSNNELEENDFLSERLMVGKDELANIRKKNIFVLSEKYDSFSVKHRR